MKLLDLPPEVRNAIWRLVVEAPYVKMLVHKPQRSLKPKTTRSGVHYDNPDPEPPSSTHLAIAFTCRQLYLEASTLYYSLNTFYHFSKPCGSILKFFEAIGPQNVALVNRMWFRYSEESKFFILKALPTSLETLKFFINKTISAEVLAALTECVKRAHLKLNIHYHTGCFHEEFEYCAMCPIKDNIKNTVLAINQEDWAKGAKKAELVNDISIFGSPVYVIEDFT